MPGSMLPIFGDQTPSGDGLAGVEIVQIVHKTKSATRPGAIAPRSCSR